MNPVYPSEMLAGPRIELRKLLLSSAPEMFQLVERDRERLSRFLPWVPRIGSVEDEEAFVRYSHECWAEAKSFDFGVFLSGRYIGSCGVHTIAWEHERCELGYWLGGAWEGQGFMSEAVSLLERELFRLGFFRLEIHCDPENLRSAAIPRRLSYELEATLRNHKIEHGSRRGTMIWSKFNNIK